jgi:hypothetical protein
MNEQIKELIEQATTEEHDGFRYFDKKKFANLLIAESLKVMQQEWYDLNNAPAVENESPRDIGIRVGKKSEVITLMHKIKEHFGVTE